MTEANQKLEAELRHLVRTERKITHQIVSKINEAELARAYADFGFPNMHEWLVKGFRYSDTAARRRLDAARALRVIPDIGSKIEEGILNLTTVCQVQVAIRAEEARTGEKMTHDDKVELLSHAESATKQEVEEKLAVLFPEKIQADVKRCINESEVRVHITFSKHQMAKIERAREVLSHKLAGAWLASVIEAGIDSLLKEKDPLVREVKAKPRKIEPAAEISTGKKLVAAIPPAKALTQSAAAAAETKTSVLQPERESGNLNRRKAIPPSVRNFVYRRDGGCCQFREPLTGRKCGSRYFVELDHIHSVALGGGNEPENLQLLCRTHNLLRAERVYGRAKMETYRLWNRGSLKG